MVLLPLGNELMLMKDAIQKATPEDLGKMQELLQTWANTIIAKK